MLPHLLLLSIWRKSVFGVISLRFSLLPQLKPARWCDASHRQADHTSCKKSVLIVSRGPNLLVGRAEPRRPQVRLFLLGVPLMDV